MDINTQKQLKKDYEIGQLTMDQMGRKYGVTRQQVWAIAKRLGCEPKRATVQKVCACGKSFTTQRKDPRIFCSQTCYIKYQLGNPDSQYGQQARKLAVTARTYQRRARALAASVLPLGDKQVIHHIDGDITNCTLQNLFVFWDHAKHLAYHHRQRKNPKAKPREYKDGLYL